MSSDSGGCWDRTSDFNRVKVARAASSLSSTGNDEKPTQAKTGESSVSGEIVARDDRSYMAVNGYVYFIQAVSGGPIKIGWAADVGSRFNSLQVAHWSELKILAVAAGTRDLEKLLHTKFIKHRVRGEWFDPVAPLTALTTRIAKRGYGASAADIEHGLQRAGIKAKSIRDHEREAGSGRSAGGRTQISKMPASALRVLARRTK